MPESENQSIASEQDKLKNYSDAINELAISKSGSTFPNNDIKHASIVIATILKHSHKEVVIYEDDLSGNVLDNTQVHCLEDSINDFVIRGGVLNIVVNKGNGRLSELGKKLCFYDEKFRNNVCVKLATEQFKKAVQFRGEKAFFCVGDKRMYRVEKSDGPNWAGAAECSFDGKVVSRELYENFMKEFDKCDAFFKRDLKKTIQTG